MGHEVVIFRNRYCRFHDFFLTVAVAAIARTGMQQLDKFANHEGVLRSVFLEWLELVERPEAGIPLRLDEIVTSDELRAALLAVFEKAKDYLQTLGPALPRDAIGVLLSRSEPDVSDLDAIPTSKVVDVIDQLGGLLNGQAPLYGQPVKK